MTIAERDVVGLWQGVGGQVGGGIVIVHRVEAGVVRLLEAVGGHVVIGPQVNHWLVYKLGGGAGPGDTFIEHVGVVSPVVHGVLHGLDPAVGQPDVVLPRRGPGPVPVLCVTKLVPAVVVLHGVGKSVVSLEAKEEVSYIIITLLLQITLRKLTRR